MGEILKINFSDFWQGFNKHDNLFINLLRQNFDVVISDTPDVLFYSCFGFEFLKYQCPKIFYTGENVRPNYMECDFSFSFDYESYGGKNFRLPLYRWNGNLEKLVGRNKVSTNTSGKEFCCMVVSNPDCKERNKFFKMLSQYKKVDSGGAYLNNIGQRVSDKTSFIQRYKFVVAFENASYPGYTTEKIIEAKLAGAVPVYWGNPLITRDFNDKSFINIHNYKCFSEAIETIIQLNENDASYEEILSQPFFNNDELPENLHFENISQTLYKVVLNLTKNNFSYSYRRQFYANANKLRKILYNRISGKPTWTF